MKIKVKVKPNSLTSCVQQISEFDFLVQLKSLPVKGKANLELLKLLKKHFKKSPRIIKGKTSQVKIIELL
ncbi:hypothetical protein GOV14_03420 [Candidatus Pacearchaeota archaeon]|nr:hypothetical protein [Candidatus Pacearchaeota archaeon]